jgi:hypothetical protein
MSLHWLELLRKADWEPMQLSNLDFAVGSCKLFKNKISTEDMK